MKHFAKLLYITCVLLFMVNPLFAETIHIEEFTRKTNRSSGGGSDVELRVMRAHKASLPKSRDTGIFGYSQDTVVSDISIKHPFTIASGEALIVYLTPDTTDSLRATISWREEAFDLDMRMTSHSIQEKPWTVDSLMRMVRGDNSLLLVERIDANVTSNDKEIVLQITARPAEFDTISGILLVSGAQFSPRMNQIATTQIQLEQEEAQMDSIVTEYIRIHKIPRRDTLEDGRIREIMRIEDGKPVYISTMNYGGAKTTHTTAVWPGGSLGLNLTGATLPNLGIWDMGSVLTSHQEFGGRVRNMNGVTANSHGTHCGGTLVAGGVVARARGVAYGAKLDSYMWSNAYSEMNSAASRGMLIASHSYGYPNSTTYDNVAYNWDMVLNNNPFFLAVKAAGNDGAGGFRTIADAAHAKNNLVVGNIMEIPNGWQKITDGRLISSSSKGPTADGRIKPEIVTKGYQVYSTDIGGTNYYSNKTGTSMAAPSAAGNAALLQEHYYNTHNRNYMRSSTLRGLIALTAGDAGTVGPDVLYGFGVLHMKRAAELISKDSVEEHGVIQELTLTSGQTLEYSYRATGLEEIKAAIAWNDPVRSTLDGRIVNDLDIRVTVDGERYLPWKLNPSNLTGAAIRGDNSVDNIEKVETGIANGAEITVTISHKGALSGGSQVVSLIISGAVLADNDTIPHYTITASSGNGGTISPEGTVVLSEGSEKEYTIRADRGYEIDSLFIDDSLISPVNIYTFEKVKEDHSIAVTFKPAAVISIVSPNKLDTLVGGHTYEIQWETDGYEEAVKIEWGHIGGNYSVIEDSLENKGSFLWTIPDTAHNKCRIQITGISGVATDYTELFTIVKNSSPRFEMNDTTLTISKNETVNLHISAKDIDGDSLIYTWSDTIPEWLEIVGTETALTLSGSPKDDTTHTVLCTLFVADIYNREAYDTCVVQLIVDKTTAIILTDESVSSGISDLVVAPNPVAQTANGVNLIIPSELSGHWTVVVSDALGNVLDEAEFEAIGGTTYTWDLHSKYGNRVASGSYVLIAQYTDRSGRTQMFRRMIGVQK